MKPDPLYGYNIEESKLYNDMDNLSYEETKCRLHKLGALIPANYNISAPRLMNKVDLLFGNNSKRIKMRSFYKIDVDKKLCDIIKNAKKIGGDQ